MTNKAVVSIIIPVYNVEPFLDDCITDVLAQSFQDFEVILVDDGSTDRSGAKCEEWASRDSRIKAIHKQNGGVCGARNTGLDHAKGEWILFVDADDRIDQELLSSLLKAQKETHADTVGTGYQFFTDGADLAHKEGLCIQNASKRQYTKLRGGEYICGALYRKAVIDQVGLRFDTSLVRHEEVYWNSIYDMYCEERAFISPPMYYYRTNPNSLMHTRTSNDTGVREWLMARKALDEWRKAQKGSLKKASCIRAGILHCEKNCYAECLSAGISFDDFKKLCDSCGIEESAWNSSAYFKCFEALLRLRKRL